MHLIETVQNNGPSGPKSPSRKAAGAYSILNLLTLILISPTDPTPRPLMMKQQSIVDETGSCVTEYLDDFDDDDYEDDEFEDGRLN